jgi:hypothetical protein
MQQADVAIGLDNFRVSLTTVPEPGVSVLLGIGATLLALRAFRRR